MAEKRPPELPVAAIRDMLRWFKSTDVPGVVIGGVAVSIQGRARYTRDLGDIDSILEAQPRLDLARIRRNVAEFAGLLERPEIIDSLEELLERDHKRGKR